MVTRGITKGFYIALLSLGHSPKELNVSVLLHYHGRAKLKSELAVSKKVISLPVAIARLHKEI